MVCCHLQASYARSIRMAYVVAAVVYKEAIEGQGERDGMSQHSFLIPYHYLDSARIEHELDGIACSAKIILFKCRIRAFGRSTSTHRKLLSVTRAPSMCKKGSSIWRSARTIFRPQVCANPAHSYSNKQNVEVCLSCRTRSACSTARIVALDTVRMRTTSLRGYLIVQQM